MNETREPGSGEPMPLQFRPAHRGVGFHPFSDGLPYAPAVPSRAASPAPQPMGTGAIAAGPARPVLTPRPQPTFTAPLQVPVAPRPAAARAPSAPLPRPEAFLRHENLQPSASLQPNIATPTDEPEVRIEKNFGWTYPLLRMLAFGIDITLNILLTTTIVTAALSFADLEPWALLEGTATELTAFFLVAFCWVLMTAQEVAFKTTIGKRVMGLRLRGSATGIFLRSFFFIPSFSFAGVGILWALFDRDKRCWHDVAVDLQPTRATQL